MIHRVFLLLSLPVMVASLFLVLMFTSAAHAQGKISNSNRTMPYTANLRGQVLDLNTNQPVFSAHVTVHEFGLTLVTDQEGFFQKLNLPISDIAVPITISINADGYGEWKTQNILFVADDTLILTPHLANYPIQRSMPPPNKSQPPHLNLDQVVDFSIEDTSIPPTITVRVTGVYTECDSSNPYTLTVVNFNEYARHVLPNEWLPGWRDEAYRAGAMAVKMYGWYWISRAGKWSDADVTDSTCDQVYNPEIERLSTNHAVDYTWKWLMRDGDGDLFQPYYKATESNCTPGFCMSQTGSQEMATDGFTWDEILEHYYSSYNPFLTYTNPKPAGFALRFFGVAGDYQENRLLFSVDNPDPNIPERPIDVGSTDFTIEWWLKTHSDENQPGSVTITCGLNQDWIYGNILLDRYIPEQGRSYGVSLNEGKIVFGVTGQAITDSLTLCGSTLITDNIWHHIAVQRSIDGQMWIFIDGKEDAYTTNGPVGDISYPDNITPTLSLVIGAWGQDDNHAVHPFYRGWIDEMHFSRILRYRSTFTPTLSRWIADEYTVGLFHFDEGRGNTIIDTSGAVGGPSNGVRRYGGDTNGPEWLPSDLFSPYRFWFNFPLVFRSIP
jgi:hypothetical protein